MGNPEPPFALTGVESDEIIASMGKVFESENTYVVRVEIAGMQHAELNIALEGRQLAIYGLRQPPSEQAAYHQLEVRYGDFLTVLDLPGEVDSSHIEAEYEDGFLIVTLGKAGVS